VITLKTGKTLIVWTGEPLLSQEVDYIVLSSTVFDPKKFVYVSFERAVNVYQIESKRSGIIHHYFVSTF